MDYEKILRILTRTHLFLSSKHFDSHSSFSNRSKSSGTPVGAHFPLAGKIEQLFLTTYPYLSFRVTWTPCKITNGEEWTNLLGYGNNIPSCSWKMSTAFVLCTAYSSHLLKYPTDLCITSERVLYSFLIIFYKALPFLMILTISMRSIFSNGAVSNYQMFVAVTFEIPGNSKYLLLENPW